MEPEIEWRDIPNFEGNYSASNTGLIRSNARVSKNNRRDIPIRERVLKATTPKRGYAVVVLCLHNKRNSCSVHRLIALTFIPNPDNKPEVNHIDNNKLNNAVSNLEWCTHKENIQHASRQGRMGNTKQDRLDQAKELLDSGLSHTEVMGRLKMCRDTIKRYFSSPTNETSVRLRRAEELLKEGVPICTVAKTLRMCTKTIKKHLPQYF